MTLEQQQAFVAELPKVFVPIAGGWGRTGMTHIRLAAAPEDVLAGGLAGDVSVARVEESKHGAK